MNSTNLIQQFINYIEFEKNLSHNTILAYKQDLKAFHQFIDEANFSIAQVDSSLVSQFFTKFSQSGRSAKTRARMQSCLREFFSYLFKLQLVLSNPLEHMEFPKLQKKLPQWLNEKEVDKVLSAPTYDSPLGIRDKAILELLYYTGMRVSELVELEIKSIQYDKECIVVNGKGSKERVVPLQKHVIFWLKKYQEEVRPLWANEEKDKNRFFLSQKRLPITRQKVWDLIKKYTEGSEASPHTLRHSFATNLLERGADLKTIQALLGHANLSTTGIYAHVQMSRLKQTVSILSPIITN